MKERIARFFAFWLGLMTLMTLLRLIFIAIEPVYSLSDLSSLPSILWHSLPMDLSMSAYLMVIPGLVLIASVWTAGKIVSRIAGWYIGLVSFLIGFAAVLDASLFPYWNFRLDSTPLFYFFTSPSAAFASLPWWTELLLMLATCLTIFLIYKALKWLWSLIGLNTCKRKIAATIVLTILTAFLIIPIRGGITVSTMTTGRGFFSTDMKLNQATVNPLFSLIYSLTHIDNLSSQFQFFDLNECDRYFDEFVHESLNDSIPKKRLTVEQPDIYIIILESFSAGLMPSLGGENIASNLDRVATEEGILFTNFYAESFRTDRALPVILSGYPAMPTASVMRYTNKLGQLPSLAKTLKNQGWTTRYYYGGDADFTNMRAYLVASGVDKIISDSDFDISQRLSKWGVHDGPLFERVIAENTDMAQPSFTVIQTSSSHEPFDVPFTKFSDPKKNAFAYTDHCLGEFVESLKSSGRWNNSLLFIVPDHWGAYPENLEEPEERHHVPLVITGGALDGAPEINDRISSQSDIAPTLLALLGIKNNSFFFGHDALDTHSPEFAWITEPDWFGIINKNGATVLTLDGNILKKSADGNDVPLAKAYIQKIYRDFSNR